MPFGGRVGERRLFRKAVNGTTARALETGAGAGCHTENDLPDQGDTQIAEVNTAEQGRAFGSGSGSAVDTAEQGRAFGSGSGSAVDTAEPGRAFGSGFGSDATTDFSTDCRASISADAEDGSQAGGSHQLDIAM
jgi:hypothetical protein